MMPLPNDYGTCLHVILDQALKLDRLQRELNEAHGKVLDLGDELDAYKRLHEEIFDARAA